MPKAAKNNSIEIAEIKRQTATFVVLGQSPLVMERMSTKAMQILLSPSGKKTATEKQSKLKHDPLTEYRDSAHVAVGDKNPTRLQMPSASFKRAMASAALEIPGAKKSQIGRLTYVPGDRVDIYGKPEMFMSIVRSSDMNRTPDVRTRCIVREWCAVVEVAFVTPQLREQDVANLLGAAGEFIGVGGGRPEKGALSFGRFLLVDEDNKDFLRISKITRKEQDDALKQPGFFDQETQDLYTWYLSDAQARGFKSVA